MNFLCNVKILIYNRILQLFTCIETFARSQKKSHKNEIIESIKSSNLGN